MKKGFTLIEVMLLVTLMAVFAAIALPRFGGWGVITQYRVKTTAQRIVADLRFTRSLAITNRVNYLLEIYPSAYEYKIYREIIDPASQVGETRNIAQTITLGGDTLFIFEPQGNSSSTAGSTLTVSEGDYRWKITVTSATGYVTMVEY